MAHPTGFDFTQFVPGFDFLKNLTPGGAAASAASAATPGWVAPTLDPEELDKRIQELKTVQFWLEQNAKAVGATIQALEVQRMTLATLKGMNMSFNDLAESLKVKPQAANAASPFAFTPAPEPQPEPQAAKAPEPEPEAKPEVDATKAAGIDPAHWWGALTDQFQNIAKHAMTDMTDMAQRASAHTNASAAKTPSAKAATSPKAKAKPAAKRVRKPAAKRASATKPAAKTAAKTAGTRSSKPAAR
jgi:ribosomal protein L12E/L44/L45/RPP1/RPP2